jgi:restriction endonuclease Mrr
MQAHHADHGIYITAGAIADNARKKAAESGIALLDGPALAEFVRRTAGARKALARASEETAKA